MYVIFFLLICFFVKASIDLESFSQDFVLATKRIVLPQFPYAFNPSIVQWRNKLIMSFRVIPDHKQPFISFIGITWLDSDFNPIGEPQLLSLRNEKNDVSSRAEDGRLIVVNDRLFLVYSDNEDVFISKNFRMYVAELVSNDSIKFIPKNIQRIHWFPGNQNLKREKNWVPFQYDKRLLLSYSLAPHIIMHPLLHNNSAEIYALSETSVQWPWGELRGGTQALLDGNSYLSFFHSSIKMASIHSQDRMVTHYFMGAYKFSSQYPFSITHVSAIPIIGKQFYHGESYKPYWGSVCCVFPCGFIMDAKHIWISYGRQDHEMWIAKLDKNKLYASLITVDI